MSANSYWPVSAQRLRWAKMKAIFFIFILTAGSAFASDETVLIARFLDYHTLPRITETKIDLAESVSALCGDPRLYDDPHIKPGIHLYVNPVAIEARKRKANSRRYPVGSLLVKEKFESKDESAPSIITVMEKVTDTGKVDDWKFYMIRVADRSIVRDAFKVSCIDCHSHYRKSDFVSTATNSLLSSYAKNKK